jgi:hypothetical protein
MRLATELIAVVTAVNNLRDLFTAKLDVRGK